jgi:hypothetical protein
MRRQLVRFILFQIIDDEDGTIRLVPVLSKFSPSDLGAVMAEDRGVGGALFPGGDFLTILALEINHMHLRIRSTTQHKPRVF